ncbi:MAG: ADP-ribosylglycohydrolase family protein [Clostridiales bacterium]|nr:ADP-ribosylglycohydrolase family protein [Clostridiales bacterium]
MIKFNRDIIKDKIYACWLGKNIGGTMGTPYEGDTNMHDIQGFSTPENVVLANDDLDLQLVWLKAIEDKGPYSLNDQILGEYWTSYIPPHWNEYGICKNNMRMGLIPPVSGEYANEWKHSNGAWIRTEVWACMAPGCPDIAMKYAQMDACVDHGAGEGTYAAMFVAAVESAAFVVHDLRKLIDIGLAKIPEDCRMAQTIRLLLDCRDKDLDWRETRQLLVEHTADLGWFQAPANVAFAMLGLLWGEGDFKKSMILAINCGDDTDCTGATLGSLFGILNGTAGIPEDWKKHIGDNIVSVAIDKGSLYGLPATCTQLTDRVYDMIPVMLKANRCNVYLSDEDQFDEADIAKFYDSTISKQLINIPGMSFENDFIWATCRVVYDGQPEIDPNGSAKVKLIVKNQQNAGSRHLNLKWHLPEGWSVSGVRKDYVLPTPTRYTSNHVVIEATINAGESVEALNRVICEITTPGRPTAGLISIVFIG